MALSPIVIHIGSGLLFMVLPIFLVNSEQYFEVDHGCLGTDLYLLPAHLLPSSM
jgi:hypothetical protein